MIAAHGLERIVSEVIIEGSSVDTTSHTRGLRRNGTENLHKECLGPEIQSFLPHRGRQQSWGELTGGF
jgi:hypothetical protein